MLRWLIGWLAATVVTYVLGASFMTQVVLFDLGSLGVDVPLGPRIATTAFDIQGLASSYLPLIAIALLIAFAIATLLARFLPKHRVPLLLLAGASSVGVLIGIMTLVFGLNPLSGTRDLSGMALQMLAGLAGAWVFLKVRPVTERPETRAGS